MALTPVEVRHIQLKRGLFGYRKAAVHRMMDDIADSFETVWRERSQLVERVEELETEVDAARRARGAAPLDARLRRARLAGSEGGRTPRGGRDRDRGECGGPQGAARRDHREGAADGRRAPRPGAAPIGARGRRREPCGGDAPRRWQSRCRRCRPRRRAAGWSSATRGRPPAPAAVPQSQQEPEGIRKLAG